MPIKVVWVAGLKRMNVVRKLDRQVITRYLVYARCAPGEIWSETYSTLDPLKASLADRARELRRPVRIASRDTVYGPEIIGIKLVEEQENHFV